MQKSWKNDWDPGTWVFIWEYSVESYPMNINMIGFRLFSKIFASLCFGRKYNLCIGRVKSHSNQPIFTALGRTLVMRRWSNEYQHDRVLMFFKNLCVLGHRMKVASTLEGLDALERLTQDIFLSWKYFVINPCRERSCHLSESYPMNTNMAGFRLFSKSLHPWALDKSSLSIGRVNTDIFWAEIIL